jgi:alpha-L-fucosidase 2
MRQIRTLALVILTTLFGVAVKAQVTEKHNLVFKSLPKQWDEALPIGNAKLGALIWQREGHLRMSLDQAELWDLRPMKGVDEPHFTYRWVGEQVKKNDYAPVQQFGDIPYEQQAAPSKIPGASLEWNSASWGNVEQARVDIKTAMAEVTWQNGVKLTTYIHASQPFGYFKFENLDTFTPELLAPKYEGESDQQKKNSVSGQDLIRLGYKQGTVEAKPNSISYRQEGWGGFYYQVHVRWEKTKAATWEGVWSISAHYPEKMATAASATLSKIVLKNTASLTNEHLKWWKTFWSKSEIALPDPVLERQYYLEQYKWGSTARRDAPPISLQAVWTADNGRLPPWKGDFHHDLNTQLSYWPTYAGNHLEEGLGYLDHLDKNKKVYTDYTKRFFEAEGLNVPGVTTLEGHQMGGWVQYSFSPTVSAWLAQHYYLHWRYSMDVDFLKKRAYPWFKEVATFLEKVSNVNDQGVRQLPLSSSPEINDNRITAWFTETTNYDISLMRFAFQKAAELADELKLTKEAEHWRTVGSSLPSYALTEKSELMIAPSLPYKSSHRHFSHLMGIHPLGEIRWENGEKDQKIIQQSLRSLDKIGPSEWCGYSYAWEGNLKARAKDGDGAAEALRIFADAFVSTNSFHLNGDQTKSGLSNFTYRPFTLEGNFAYASGIQEMLLQSYAGRIEVFPAIPADWGKTSFQNLRAEGAFLVSALQNSGVTDEVTITAEKGGTAKLKLPFKTHFIRDQNGAEIVKSEDGIMEIAMQKGGKITLKNGYE